MKNELRLRFWLEMGIAVCATTLLGVTLMWNDWIETVFYVNADNHNGLVEWLIVGASLVLAIMHFTLAVREWQRTQKRGYRYE
jgi:hypothetical protein